jgi:addiction module HigA family antidote
MNKPLSLPTPGEILATEFLEPMGLTQYRLAQAIHVPQTRIAAIVKNGRSITADTAPCALLRHVRGVLDESAKPVRRRYRA